MRCSTFGASSGISSAEWLQALERAGFDVRIVATDLSLTATLVRLAPGYEVLADRSGHLLQHIVLGIPIRAWRRRRDYVTGGALVSGLLNPAGRLLLATRGGTSRARGERIVLVSARAASHERLTFIEDDVLEPNAAALVGRFDAVRAANVLNRGYFTAAQLRRALTHLKARLTGAGAFLIVGRTRADATNHATVFRLNDAGRFDAVDRLRNGSEIEDLVLES